MIVRFTMLSTAILVWSHIWPDASWTVEFVFRTISQISLDNPRNINFDSSPVASSSTALSRLLYLQHPKSEPWILMIRWICNKMIKLLFFLENKFHKPHPLKVILAAQPDRKFSNSEAHYIENFLLMIQVRQMDSSLQLHLCSIMAGD